MSWDARGFAICKAGRASLVVGDEAVRLPPSEGLCNAASRAQSKEFSETIIRPTKIQVFPPQRIACGIRQISEVDQISLSGERAKYSRPTC